MIALLRGDLVKRDADGGVVLVGGVGYQVYIPRTSLAQLPATGEVELHIHTSVREDAIELFGFADEFDRDLFVRLISVSGIGPRLGLATLSALSGASLVEAIVRGDVAALKAVKGVGKKTAERLVVELRDVMQKLGVPSGAGPAVAVPPVSSIAVLDDLRSALINLGYPDSEADRVAGQLRDRVDKEPFELLLREALKMLA